MTMMPYGKTLAYRCSSQGMQTSGTPQVRMGAFAGSVEARNN